MDEILKYFSNITPTQRQQFTAIGPLYNEWNQRINVISRKDIDNLYLHHILHSLAIARFFTPVSGTTFLDMGTGGGFPGIPLAILWPDCTFHLIDRIGKKLKVAADIADKIGLRNVTFQHGDIAECRNRYDFVVSRAVMQLDALIPLVARNVDRVSRNSIPNGLICLKGLNLADEIARCRRPVLEVPLSDWFNEPYFQSKALIYTAL